MKQIEQFNSKYEIGDIMFECPVFVFREDNHGSAAYKGTRPGLQDQGGEELRLKGWKFAF